MPSWNIYFKTVKL